MIAPRTDGDDDLVLFVVVYRLFFSLWERSSGGGHLCSVCGCFVFYVFEGDFR